VEIVKVTPELIDSLCGQLESIFPPDHIDEWRKANQFIKYQNDPVGFGTNILKEVYTEDIKRMMESVRDFRVTVAISANGTGKSFSAASLVVWWYKCFPDSKVFTAAAPPEDNLRNILWGEIAKKQSKVPELFEHDKIKDLSISKNKWHFVEGVTIPQAGNEAQREAKFSGRHAPHLLFVIDEGDAVPNEVYRGIDACMSGTHDRLLILFNPRAKMGKVYDYIINGIANVVELQAFNHPNVVRGINVIPGAVSREITVQRINEQTRPLLEGEEPDSKCFELPSFLEGSVASHPRSGDPYPPLPPGWRKVKDECPEFWYKVLAKYPPQGANQLVNADWVRDARARWDLYTSIHGDQPPEGIHPICGLDVADMGDDSNVLCSRYGGYVARMERWSGVDPAETADRAADKGMQYGSYCINVDAIGVGAGVSHGIRKKGVRANRVDVHNKPTKVPPDKEHAKFGILRDQILWEVRVWLKEDPTAMLPPNDKLLQELELLTYEEDNGKIRIMPTDKIRSLIGRSPDDLMALALTFSPRERSPKVRKII